MPGLGGRAFLAKPATASYQSTVLADSPLAYWPMQETSGTTLEDVAGSNDLTISGATVNQSGPSTQKAVGFDGVNDYAVSGAAVDLSGTGGVTIEAWFYWASFANDNDVLLAQGNEATRSIFVVPNASVGSFRCGHGPGYNTSEFTRPSSSAWHHLVSVHNLSLAASTEVVPYIDGTAVSYTKANANNGSGSFTSQLVYLMSNFGASSGFGSGRLCHVAIYPTALTSTQISNHYAAMT